MGSWQPKRAPCSSPRMTRDDDALAKLIGVSLGRLRQGRGWWQAQLAERLDLSVDYISRLEVGRRMPSVPVLVAMAREFSVGVDQFLGFVEPNLWSLQAMVLLDQVPREHQDAVLAMLRGIVGFSASASMPSRIGARRRRKRSA